MATRVHAVRLDPLGPLFLRPPSPFTAGVYGPGALGASLSYPMPSTIAGLLAFQAFRRGLCTGAPGQAGDHGEYMDQAECLEALAGQGVRLYTGLLWSGGRLHAYQNTSSMPTLEALAEAARRTLCKGRPVPPEGLMVEAARERRTGVALKHGSKSVDEGLLYSIERIIYRPRASILALLVSPENPGLDSAAKIGGRGGLVHITTEPAEAQQAYLRPGAYAAVLISPALLGDSPFTGPVIVSGEKARKALAAQLIREAHGDEAAIDGRVLVVPKGEWMLEALMPGWSLAGKRPRRPMLVVPPGTVLRLELGESLEAVRLGGYYLVGLGCCSRLGWGTALIVPA